MLGTPKISAGLSPTRLLQVASCLRCDPAVLDQLLILVDPSAQRYQLARRYQRHRVAADVLIANKDRQQLVQLQAAVQDPAVVQYIENALKVSSTRWKN